MELNVFEDCWQLVQHFHRLALEEQHASFELFCRCWRDLQMQHLYSAQTNNIEVIATTLAALHLAKRLACARRPNGETFEAARSQRLAGFYLMYVIYNKQPTQHFVKIEVSPSTWHKLCSYVQELRNESPERQDTQQVCYIFWHLVQQQKAFRFTALDYCQALDGLVAYDSLESIYGNKNRNQALVLKNQQVRFNQANLKDDLEGLNELNRACPSLCMLEEAYNKQKEKLEGQEQPLPGTTIFSQLQEVFNEINQLLVGSNKSQASADAENDDDDSSDSETEELEEQPTTSAHSQLELRQRVRFKAMYGEEGKKKSPSKKDQMKPAETLALTKEMHQRRMSSATIFVKKLPMEVTQEYDLDSDVEVMETEAEKK